MDSELLKLLTNAGATGLIFGAVLAMAKIITRVLDVIGARDKQDASKDEHQSRQVTGLTEALVAFAGFFEAQTETQKALHEEIIGNRGAIGSLQERLNETTNIMATVTSQRNRDIEAMKRSIDALPSAVKLALVEDFEKMGDTLTVLNAQTSNLNHNVTTALSDWAGMGTRLQTMFATIQSLGAKSDEGEPGIAGD